MSPLQTAVTAQRGYSLLELLIVIALLALIASVAAPSFDRNDDLKLDRAAEAVAAALRFARSEAIRTGAEHGLTISQDTQKVTVQRYDMTNSPISALYTLTNPLDKQPYDFNVNTARGTEGVTISNADDVFNFSGLGRRRSLIFDGIGVPKWFVASTSTTYLLAEAKVELSYEGRQRVVDLAPMTGRVTVQ